MGKASRTKGKTGEREVGHLIGDAGLDASREQDGRNQACDWRIHDPAIDLEVRRRENLSLNAWSREIEAKTPEGRIPAVAYRTNREPWRISMPLKDFFALLPACTMDVLARLAEEEDLSDLPGPTLEAKQGGTG